MKPFGRGAMPKWQMIDAKSAETGMLLERIDKMVEVQNLLLYRLNISKGSEGLAPVSLQEASLCANCSRFNHIELDYTVMVIQGQGMFRQGPSRGPTQQGRHIIISLFSIILHRMQDLGGTTINPIVHHKMVSNHNNST